MSSSSRKGSRKSSNKSSGSIVVRIVVVSVVRVVPQPLVAWLNLSDRNWSMVERFKIPSSCSVSTMCCGGNREGDR